jgi:phage terminase Nu1 subunit (DNA packaging protein)
MQKHFIVSMARLAESFQVSKSMVSQYKKAGMPKVGPNKYDLDECWKWRVEQLQAKDEIDSITDERKKLVIAQRRLKELELENECNKYCYTEDVVEHWRNIAVLTRTQLMAIPSKVAVRLVACETPREVAALLDQEIRDALHAISTSGVPPERYKPKSKQRNENGANHDEA